MSAGALRLLATVACWTLLGLGVGLAGALAVPLAFDMRPLVVLSGSMEPVLDVGDVTVVERIRPDEARVGDVVTFTAPHTGRLTTHRVRASRRAGAEIEFVTKGDANNATERWTVPADGQLSRAVYRVPLIGHVALRLRSPLGWALLVAIPLLVLAGQELWRTWRPTPAVDDARLA